MNNLVDSWLDAAHGLGKSQAQAIRDMNEALKSRYTSSRVNEWRDGRRVPNAAVIRYMLGFAVPYAIRWTQPDLLKKISDPADFTMRMVQALSPAHKKARKQHASGLGFLSVRDWSLHGPRTGGMPSPGHHHGKCPFSMTRLTFPVRH